MIFFLTGTARLIGGIRLLSVHRTGTAILCSVKALIGRSSKWVYAQVHLFPGLSRCHFLDRISTQCRSAAASEIIFRFFARKINIPTLTPYLCFNTYNSLKSSILRFWPSSLIAVCLGIRNAPANQNAASSSSIPSSSFRTRCPSS